MTTAELIKANVSISASGCWLWTGKVTTLGYGVIRIDGKKQYAHRLSYAAFKGEMPEGKPFVCHSCDTPACVNPDHLWAGSPRDNQRDMWDKGRDGLSILSEAQVLEIRARIVSGERVGALATEYGVENTTISNINSGKSWSHLPVTPVLRTNKRISPEREKEIRARYAAGETQCELAKAFKVHQGTISNLLNNKWSYGTAA